MKLSLHLVIGCLAFSSFSLKIQAQNQQVAKTQIQVNNSAEKCGFSQRHEQLLQNDASYALKRQQEEAHIAAFSQNPFVDKVVKTIPVVVHVIHTGQAIGTGANISDAQIISAINNLNAAYSNTNTANTTYTGLNTEIQFCLAQRDPNGNPHSGINRVNGSSLAGYSTSGIKTSGTLGAADVDVKALSKWDNTKYYNFWIVTEINNNDGGAGTQGYAYLPGAGPTLDGAVMLYNAFGYDPTGALGYNLKNYTNRNVTAIHEVGHALNLYHTFEGDGGGGSCPGAGNLCGLGVGDCVSDTPTHRRSDSDCVTATNTCTGTSSSLHIHNFMDYSSDVCQTEFTAGQSTRMNATLTGAGLRASLTLSDGCNPVFANDAGITAIIAPTGTYCLTTFAPQVRLKNIGTSNLTSVTINYNIDGGANQIKNWTGNLASGASEIVTLNSISTSAGAHNFTATTSLPNGVADQFTTNDSKTDPFTISSSSSLPVSQGFNSLPFAPVNWAITQNPTDATTWQRFTAAHFNGASTACVYMNGYDYGTTGTKDNLVTESISLSGTSDPTLTFKIAYKNYPNLVNYDTLRVFASNDCGVSYGAFLYEKIGNVLATSGSDANGFVPTALSDWRTETINLSSYIGQNVVLKFEFTNAYGNNLYLDDINLTDNCTSPLVTTQPTNKTICSTLNTSFTVVNSGGGTYQWQLSTNGGGTFSDVSNGGVYTNTSTATLNISGATTGINNNQYRCVITNGCGAINSNAATLTVNATPATPTISAGGTTTFCSGGNVVLTSSSASGNTWSTGATTQTITVNTSGNYTVGVTSSGCTSASSTSTIVTVNSNPTITNGTLTNPSACLATDGSIQVSGTGTGNLTWSGTTSGSMNGVSLPATIAGLGAGSYSVSFNNGCVSNILTPSLSDPGAPATPTISAGGATTFCTGGSVVLTSSASSGNNWSTGATTQSIMVNTAGSYTVNVSVSGCTSATSSATSVTVNATPATPTISAGGATTFCSGGNVVLTSSASSGNTWSTGATTQTITVSSTQNISVTQTVTGCTSGSSANIAITSNPLPNITLGTITNPSACLTSDGNIIINGSGTGTITWTGVMAGNSGVVTLPTTIPNLMAGSYNFVFDNGCQSNSLVASLSDPGAPATPTVSASGPLSICLGESVLLTSSSAIDNNWSNGETTAAITVTVAGSYTVFVQTAGCTSGTSSASVVIVNTTPIIPTISAGGATIFCEGESVTLTSSEASGNVWSSGETTNSITVSTPDTYNVTVGTGNCAGTSTNEIVIVNTNPIVSLATFADVCNTSASFTLNQGTPANGTYTVNAITTTSFNPATATVGANTIVYSVTDTNSCSGSANQTIVVNDCSNLSETTNSIFEIYPNPASEVINISGDKTNLISAWKIVDATGREVLSAQNLGEIKTISTSKLANGSYHLILIGSSFEETKKIQILK